MKKKIIFFFALIIVLISINISLGYLNMYLVDHKDIGGHINVDEISEDRLTMLHFYTSEVSVHSYQNKEVSFVKFGLKSPFNMYINKSIVVQNHMENYDKYVNENYLHYHIGSNDYIKGVADTYIDIIPSEKNKHSTFFVGDEINITRLIIIKNIVVVGLIILLCMSLIIGVFANYKSKWFIAYVLSFPLIIINFNIWIIVVSTLVYFNNGSILSKKYNIHFALILIVFGILINNTYIYLAILLMALFYQWYKSETTRLINTLLSLGLFFSIHFFDYEFSLFQLFYKEIHLIPFILYNLLMSYRMYISKTETVGVELLRGINHDFKIPLSVLKLNNEMLLHDPFEIEAKRNSLLNSSSEAIKTLQSMLNSINVFLSNNSYVSKNYHTSILDSIKKTKGIFSKRDKKIELIVNSDSNDTLLPIDPIWLERLIFNVLDNAYKYTDDYGTITLTYKKENYYMLLIVEDTGIGMTKEELKKITTPFYRVDKSRSVSGLGLGLSIVEDIVNSLKGELIIDSKPGEGTIVTIKI